MLYCPYTHTSPPICQIMKIEEMRGDVVELLKEAMEKRKKTCIRWGNQADCGGAMCVEILAEDEHSIKVLIDDWGGCWGSIDLTIVATIPKHMVEKWISEK